MKRFRSTIAESTQMRFVLLGASIFGCELLIMLVLGRTPILPSWKGAMVDAALLTLLVYPLLHYTVFRPLTAQISARCRAETEAEVGAKQEQFLLENMQLGFAYCRLVFADGQPRDYTYLRVNRAFEGIVGRTDFVGKNASELFPGIHESDPQLLQTFSRVARTGQAEVFETHVQNVDRWVSISVYCPEPGHFVALAEVTTERKRAAAELKRVEEQFRQAQKMEAVGQLAGGVAHDFNNLLAAVLMHLGLLQSDRGIDLKTRQSLRDLEREAQRGAGLTRQLLAFSRQQAMEPQVLDLNQSLTDVMKMLRRLLGEHIALALEAAPGLPPIEADPGMIEQVVINLCVNARDAMPKGGRLVLRTSAIELRPDEPSVHPDARPGWYVRLEVIDEGCGIDPATLQHIFEPFYTTKQAGKGTGLGLATVYGIVKQHGGWIAVESEVGRGATFRIHLPRSAEIAPAATDTDEAGIQEGRNELVLLVEDEATVRYAVAETLRFHGYEVLEAANGPEALAHERKHGRAIRLLLSDMVMPEGWSGRELAEEIRQRNPALRVIIFTGYSQELAARPLDPGLNFTTLRKPSNSRELLRTVREVIDAATPAAV